MALPENLSKLTGVAKVLGGAFGLGWLGYNSLYTVDGGHRAVVFNRFQGVKDQVYGEGTHLVLPWVEWPVIFDVRKRPKELPSLTGTRDLQYVQISLRVLYAPDTRDLPQILRQYGIDYDKRILPSIMNETLKAVVAQYNAEQLTTQREEVSRLIRRNLTERAEEFSIQIEDCAITQLSFGREYTKAVEDKQVAQQEAERAKYLVELATQDRRSKIIHAEGETEAAKMIGQAMQKNPAFAELRRIDAAREIARSIASSHNRVFLNSDALLVNLMTDFGGSTGSGKYSGTTANTP